MAIINSYPKDINIQDKDAWIGTDSYNRQTRQYTAEAVAKYLNTKGRVSVAGQVNYKFVQLPKTGAGTIALTTGGGDGTPFSAINEFKISKFDLSGQTVVAYLDFLVNEEILMISQTDKEAFGHYKVTSYVVDPVTPNFYTIQLLFLKGNGSIQVDDYYDIANFAFKDSGYVTGINAGEYINIDNPNGTVPTINHNITSRVDTSSADSALTFPVIDTITTNNTGHVTSVNTKTVTVPASIGGSGTTNFVTKWSSASTITDSLFSDDGSTITLSTNGGSNTFDLSHTSGGGVALNIAKGGSGEALLINKTSGSGNAVSITGDSYFNGDVGIGTTSPGSKLHVDNGNVLITNSSNASLNVERNNGADIQIKSQPTFGYIGTMNDMPFQIRQNGSPVARFNDDNTISLSGEVSVDGALNADSLRTVGNILGDDIDAVGDITALGDITANDTFYVGNGGHGVARENDFYTNIQFPDDNVIKLTASEEISLDTSSFILARYNTPHLTITPITNYSQIDSNQSIRFSVDGDNKLTIGENGIISISAIGVGDATANLVCPGSFQVGNSMSFNPENQAGLTEADAGTMTYFEGPNKSSLFMVMKTGTNPDVYEQVVIKESAY